MSREWKLERSSWTRDNDLPVFETLVLMQNHFETPIRARAAAWFKDAVMKKRVEESLKLEKTTFCEDDQKLEAKMSRDTIFWRIPGGNCS